MSLPFKLHSLAELDVLGACDWYDQQQPGLGDRFIAALGEAIVRASRWPNAGTPAIRDDKCDVIERRVATAGFPYAVRYRVADGQLVVMAGYHQRHQPDFASDRIPVGRIRPRWRRDRLATLAARRSTRVRSSTPQQRHHPCIRTARPGVDRRRTATRCASHRPRRSSAQ